MLLFERELLGLYLSRHPLDGYGGYLEEHALPLESLNTTMDGKSVTVGGVVTTVRSILTKNGSKMAFVKIEDKSSECELIVFPGVYEKLNSVWEQDQVVIAKGKINYKDREGNMGQELKILVDQANMVSEEDAKAYQPKGKKPKPPKGAKPTAVAKTPIQPVVIVPVDPTVKKTVYVQIKDPQDSTRLKQLKDTAHKFAGSEQVVLVLGEGTTKTAMKMPFSVDYSTDFVGALAEYFDKEDIVYK